MEFRLQEELQALQDIERYQISDEVDVEGANEGELEEILEGSIESLVNSPENISDIRTFDIYKSFLKHFDRLTGPIRGKLLDSICSTLTAELEATTRDLEHEVIDSLPIHKQTLEQLTFLLAWFVNVAEKSTGKSGVVEKPKRGKSTKKKTQSDEWKWEDQVIPTLTVISKVLKLKTQRIWSTTPERDAFINCVTRPAWLLSESEHHIKDQVTKLLIFKILALAIKHHSHAASAQTHILQSLQYTDHLSEPLAELLAVLAKEFDHSQLAEEVLRELGAREFSAQDSKGPRSFSKFLMRMAEVVPRIVGKQISLLLPHIDSESYPMRMALVEVTGTLIRELAALEEGEREARDKKLNNLFELLTERFLDVSSYVRAKVINTLSKICDLPQKFPKHRLQITTLTIAALEDKSSSVRRYAIALLTKLILTHPYGLMHGGLLKKEDWLGRLKEVSDGLEKLEKVEGALEGDRQGEETETDGEDEDEEDEDGEESEESDDDEVQDGKTEVHETPNTVRVKKFKRSSTASRASTIRRSSTALTNGSQSMEIDGDRTILADVEEGDEEEDETRDREDDDDETAVEEGEDFTQQFVGEGLVPGTPARTDRSMSEVPMTPNTPARSRRVPKTPGAKSARSSKSDPASLSVSQKKKKKKKAKKPRKTLDITALTTSQTDLADLTQTHSQMLTLRLRKKYYSEGLDFISQIEVAMGVLSQLLVSTSKAEVLESMEFFRVAYEYQFETASIGIKKMIHLIWSKDNTSTGEDGKELRGIRSKLIECYRGLYFDPLPDLEPSQQVNRIAKNMIQLTYSATLAELTSLEELIRTMMLDGQIHIDVITKLWQVYISSKQLPREQRRGAIIILGMLAVANRSVVSERVEMLIKIGLGSLGKDDLILARYTMIALQRLNGSVKKVKGSLSDKSVRLPMDHIIFKKLKEAVERPCRQRDWFGMAEQAINTIYVLGEHPDRLCDELIKNLAALAFSNTRTITRESPLVEPLDPNQQSQVSESPKVEGDEAATTSIRSSPTFASSSSAADSFEMAQVLHIVGHVAIRHLVFLEIVERELKRQKDAQLKDGSRQKSNKDKGEELDQVAGNAEDEIGERIAAIRESEMLYGPHSLLGAFGPLLVQICGSPRNYTNPILRTSATLAFSKFLCVSSQFCDEHHRLLFKILETSRDHSIRSNIVIALGDIAVCFSNIVDENSDELYKGLSDRNLTVKKNTLLVLTHLILNGMIKVKGQLGEMAKCLEDEEPRVADLAKLFFTELATKENAIYNNLPDVISHLSVGQHAVDEEAFQSTMRYIFQFIEKERQAENIVEKLCQRFRLTEDPRQWRDIAFCLSLLPFKSEKSVKRLIEGLPFYQDKLHEEAVFNRFNEILQKARANKSSNKPDTELKEFEVILTEFKQKGADDQDFEKKVEAKKSAASKRVAKRNARKGVAKRGKVSKQLSSSDEDEPPRGQKEVGTEEDEPPKPTRSTAARKKAPVRRGKATRAAPSSEEEDAGGNEVSEEEEEEVQVKSTKKAAAPRRNARKRVPVIEDSDTE